MTDSLFFLFCFSYFYLLEDLFSKFYKFVITEYVHCIACLRLLHTCCFCFSVKQKGNYRLLLAETYESLKFNKFIKGFNGQTKEISYEIYSTNFLVGSPSVDDWFLCDLTIHLGSWLLSKLVDPEEVTLLRDDWLTNGGISAISSILLGSFEWMSVALSR